MRSSSTIVLCCVLAVLWSFSWQAQPAQAGFVSVGASTANPPGHGPPDFVWDLLPDESGNAQSVLAELFDLPPGESLDVLISGVTDSDPVLTITKDILNGTGKAWVGYDITLDSFDTDTFVGVPSSGGTSGGMTLGLQGAYNLNWTTPNVVLPGQTVTFTFQVNVPDTGGFNFTLSQSPVLIPEPASIVLVGLAVVMLAACRRKFVG